MPFRFFRKFLTDFIKKGKIQKIISSSVASFLNHLLDAPYIESLTASQNPLAVGSTVRLTCIVAPTPTAHQWLGQHSWDATRVRHSKFGDIQFAWHRLRRSKGDTRSNRSPIVNRVEQPNAFTSALELQNMQYEEGTIFECTAEDRRGRRAVRQIQLDVHRK